MEVTNGTVHMYLSAGIKKAAIGSSKIPANWLSLNLSSFQTEPADIPAGTLMYCLNA